MNILAQIVETKQQEIAALYQQYDLDTLKQETQPTPRAFYEALGAARAEGRPFFISEFKRKSPSEGWINRDADLPAQLRAYARAGAGAISVLSDEPWFGGTYADLRLATETLDTLGTPRPLLLQKDFMLDPIQIYLARQHGADLILLIAAILEPAQLLALRRVAESLGMGVLTEIHDEEEWDKIAALRCPVVGINSRDLKTFRTALNRVSVLRSRIGSDTMIVAESGIRDYRDFRLVRDADAFLIGTGLMRDSGRFRESADFATFYQSPRPYLFKACGLRSAELLAQYRESPIQGSSVEAPDFIGVNFSPHSKRRITDVAALAALEKPPAHFVAVFYGNSESEIREILKQYPFQTVQLYAHEVSPEFVLSLKQRIFLALPVREAGDLARLEPFAADVDVFILDGATPGSGQRIGAHIPPDFPYPFFLAGGLHLDNLSAVREYRHCVGVDIASGIESEGGVSVDKIREIGLALARPV